MTKVPECRTDERCRCVTPGLVGTVTATKTTDALSGTLTIKGSDGATTVINLATGNNGSSYDQATLLTAINSGGYGIAATQTGTSLAFTSTDSTVTVTGAKVTTTIAVTPPHLRDPRDITQLGW